MAAPPITFAPPPAVIDRWRAALAVICTSLLVMSGGASNAWASGDCDPLDGAAPGAEDCEPCDPVSGESPVITETEAAADSVCDPCDASSADADADAEPCLAPQAVTPPEEPVAEATVPALPTAPLPSSGPDIPRLPAPAPAAPAAPNPNPAPAPNPAAPTTPTPTSPTRTSPPRTPSPSSDVGAQGGTPSLLEASDDAFDFGPSEDAPPLVVPGPPTDSGAPPGTSLDDGFDGFDQEDVADLTDVPSPDVAGAERDLAFESQGGRDDRGLPEPRTAPPATDGAGGGDALPVDRDQRAPALLLLLGVLATGLLAATTLEPAPRTAPEVSPPRRLGLLRRRPRSPKP